MSESPITDPGEPARLRLVTPDPDPDTGLDLGPGPDFEAGVVPDAETAPVEATTAGVPVDAAAEVGLGTTWAALTSTNTTGRAPIIPVWMRSRRDRSVTMRALAGNLSYYARFHAARSPKYAAKTAVYAPVGIRRVAARLGRWASAEDGNWGLRQHAARTNDPYTWQSLNRVRAKESRARWWILLPATAAAVVAAAVVHAVVPALVWYALLAGVVLVAARVGRPADKPITDRVANGPRFTKLTAEKVRGALIALRFPVMREPGSVEFVHPGIHRDGPGWLARVNLPQGLEAVNVLERRGALSSALRLPVDQVWPAAGPDHAGQLDLWVGYQPASKMGVPTWSLADPAARTSYFALEEFGTDQRQRPVRTMLFSQNFLIGGRPGSGKSYAGRSIVTIGALDPTVQLLVAEYKGTGDFLDLAPRCSTYVCGLADADFAAGLAMLNWGLAEAERRGARIKAAYERGQAPERKVTPELAAKPGSGLHPILMVFDEAHELFGDATVGKEAGIAAERLAKRGRALGITLVIITQIPDKDSLPTGITRNIGIRWCLAVPDQVANDMILGTGAYKRGITGTVYRPVIDAGWGVLTGLAEPVAVHSHFPDPKTTAGIVARATALRGGQKVGDADLPTARDLLADLAAVAAPNGQHWAPAAAALPARWPHAYPNLNGEALSELARAAGVPSVDVKINRRTVKGYRTDTLRGLIADRPDPDGGGAGR